MILDEKDKIEPIVINPFQSSKGGLDKIGLALGVQGIVFLCALGIATGYSEAWQFSQWVMCFFSVFFGCFFIAVFTVPLAYLIINLILYFIGKLFIQPTGNKKLIAWYSNCYINPDTCLLILGVLETVFMILVIIGS